MVVEPWFVFRCVYWKAWEGVYLYIGEVKRKGGWDQLFSHFRGMRFQPTSNCAHQFIH